MFKRSVEPGQQRGGGPLRARLPGAVAAEGVARAAGAARGAARAPHVARDAVRRHAGACAGGGLAGVAYLIPPCNIIDMIYTSMKISGRGTHRIESGRKGRGDRPNIH